MKREGDPTMTNETLEGLKVAILVTDGFEQVELERPRRALDQAGAQTQIVSPKAERVRAWKFSEWGDRLPVDVALDQAKPQDFDALLLPGGLVNLDALRIQPKAMAFAKAFFDADKPVAAICRGPWTITEINAARGRRMTSCSSLETDLKNAGADWVDQEVVVDRNLVTSRSPSEIPTFNREMIKLFSAARGRQDAA
jgi:protease I